jgi:hypothetical protein
VVCGVAVSLVLCAVDPPTGEGGFWPPVQVERPTVIRGGLGCRSYVSNETTPL